MTLVGLLALVVAFAGALAAVLVLASATLARPAWLHLGWAALLVVLCEGLARHARARHRAAFGDPKVTPQLIEGRLRGVRSLRAVAVAWALLLLAVACSRPQWGLAEEEVRRKGVDVFLVVDTSRSMAAQDAKPSRMARARIALASLLDQLAGDRVALLAFAGDARTVCPLTLDQGAVKLFVDLLEPDVLQTPGTAIAPALDLVRRSASASEGRSVAVVLITDGEDNDGHGLDAAKRLAEAGIVVHVIGIGGGEGAPIPVDDAGDGRPGWLKDSEGKTVMTRMDAPGLQAIAKATGGLYYAASSSEIELEAIASQVASMEQRDLATTRVRLRVDRQAPFLAAAFALLALELLLPDGAPFRMKPQLARTQRVAAAALRGRRASSLSGGGP